MNPVPSRGGNLVAILPPDAEGQCSCSPEERDVIASTTALAFPNPLDRSAFDVCIVRLIISPSIFSDVNEDKVIDLADTLLISRSPFYSLDPAASVPSLCPVATPESCGRVDVNRDGKVNQLDITSILQSARLGTPVPCGGVYASQFSCGSSRSAPLVPAVGISLDNIQYFSDDGLLAGSFVEDDSLLRRSNRFPEENLQCDMNHQIMSHVTSLQMESSAHAQARAQDKEAQAQELRKVHEARAQDKDTVRQLQEELRKLQDSRSPTQGVLGAVATVVAVVAAAVAALALLLSFRR